MGRAILGPLLTAPPRTPRREGLRWYHIPLLEQTPPSRIARKRPQGGSNVFELRWRG